jgi:RNA polymerase sigma-70 factor (ECF subfamily)
VSDVEAELKALMLRGLAGDAGAHGRLLSELSGYLRRYFARRLGADAADVEDLVQEALLAIHLKRATYDPERPFTPWAYALARYKLLDFFRRAGVRRTAPLEEAEALFERVEIEPGAVSADLEKMLGGLNERQSGLIRDVKITGLSMEEASAKTGMTVGAVKVSVHRAMQAMMKRVRDEDR